MPHELATSTPKFQTHRTLQSEKWPVVRILLKTRYTVVGNLISEYGQSWMAMQVSGVLG